MEKRTTKKDNPNKTTYILMAFAVLLLVFTVVQTVQIEQLKESVGSGGVNVLGTQKTSLTAPLGSGNAPAPTMVGGC